MLVRKHRAPKGALRPLIISRQRLSTHQVRKHRAPKGALRPAGSSNGSVSQNAGQKAPSAKRCIKTRVGGGHVYGDLRSQKAPSAKRCIKTRGLPPRGARLFCLCQKAPSAKRCIKTREMRGWLTIRTHKVRKHRAPKGALRPGQSSAQGQPALSESTERQKVH